MHIYTIKFNIVFTMTVGNILTNSPFSLCCRATTHSDLVLRAVKLGIPYKVVHNTSIMNAVGCCGLQVSALGYIKLTCIFALEIIEN